MGFMDKVKDFVAPVDDDDQGYEPETPKKSEVEPEPASRYERPAARKAGASSLNSNTKMVLFEPRSFSEAEEVGQRLKEGRAG